MFYTLFQSEGERVVPMYQHVESDPYRPDFWLETINAKVLYSKILFCEELGRHKDRSPHPCWLKIEIASLAEAEIPNFDHSVLGNQNIGWLQISMNDSLHLKVMEAAA